MSDSNEENEEGRNNGLNIGNDLVTALLNITTRVSQEPGNGSNLESLDAISGEYSSLNSTMDELNKFMDRWEARHSRLRDQIQEVLVEQQQDGDESSGDASVESNKSSDLPTTVVKPEDSSLEEEVKCQNETSSLSTTRHSSSDIPDSGDNCVKEDEPV